MTPTKTAPKLVKAVKPVAAHKTATTPAAPATKSRFFRGLGGRKTATAQVRLTPGSSGITINGKEYKQYFQSLKLQSVVVSALDAAEAKNAVGVTVHVSGSGLSSQADAVRHGISRALVRWNEELRKKLKREGFLTRDARAVERKKYGLKKARRAPQWAKR